MSRALFTAVSGLRTHQEWLDVIGDNVANANTPGFKAANVVFQDILGQTLSTGVAPTPDRGGTNPMQVGLGVTVGSITPSFLQGSIQTTGRNTDLAIQGAGFFVLTNGEDRVYTRAGSFTVDANGNLVDASTGFKVLGATGEIQINQGQEQAARGTTQALFKGNLDATAPDGASYVATFDIRDSLGAAHTLRITFTKNFAASPGRWDWEVTGADAALAGVTGARGALVFDANGRLAAQAVQAWTLVDDVTGDSANANAYQGIDTATDLEIAGPLGTAFVGTTTAADDPVSAMSPATSAIATARQINVLSSSTGVFAQVTPASITYGGGTFASDITLDGSAGASLVINGTAITGAVTGSSASARRDALVSLINQSVAATGVVATASGADDFVLVAADGRNISIKTDATVGPTSVNAVMFGFATGLATETVVKRGGVTLRATGDFTTTETNVPADQIAGEGLATASAAQGVSQVIALEFVASSSVATPQALTLDFGSPTNTTAVTGLASASTLTLASQDGRAPGTLQNFAIGLDGTITAFFSNGTTEAIDTVQLATFANPGGLLKIGTNLWRESATSGVPNVGSPGTADRGTLIAGALEASNVDLAKEFTNMILAQRGFQANARTISTANEMLDELVHLKR
jgi:flagellar hook protein FlgE